MVPYEAGIGLFLNVSFKVASRICTGGVKETATVSSPLKMLQVAPSFTGENHHVREFSHTCANSGF